MSLMSMIDTTWSVIKADVRKFIGYVEAAVVWLDKEAPIIIAWANKIDPAVGAALALFVHAGELGMETLARHAASGLSNTVDSLVTGLETSIGNSIQSSGLSVAQKEALTAADVAVLNKLKTAYHAAVDANFAKVIASLAPPLTVAAPTV